MQRLPARTASLTTKIVKKGLQTKQYARRWHPKVSKGSEAPTPPVAEIGGEKEGSEKEQGKRKRRNATIELAGLTGKPFGRAEARSFTSLKN